jgi:hypothetical protein
MPKQKNELLERAWGLISNAGAVWDDSAWRRVADRWRDDWLRSYRPSVADLPAWSMWIFLAIGAVVGAVVVGR